LPSRLESQKLYLGQTLPLDFLLFSRADVPLKNVSAYQYDAAGLGYKFLNNVRTGTQVINGQTFNVVILEGVIAPTQAGALVFGPATIKAHLAVASKNRRGTFGDDFFDNFFGRSEVLPLPAEGRPADFAGAVGQWTLSVEAKPAEVHVGDPITLTMRIAGTGNIDTVATPALTGLDHFKTYDPTSKTTKNELSTSGERVFEQVLVPKNTEATELPAVRLSYFDPVARAYKTAVAGPFKFTIKPGNAATVVSGAAKAHAAERLGEDIVYLKGAAGTVPGAMPVGLFALLNGLPVLILAGGLVWKRQCDRLRGDVALARRSRAAREARKILAGAKTLEEVQRALQSYLGDRLNIPASGITGAVAEEYGLPGSVREIFAASDAARFAGLKVEVPDLKVKVEQVIDELENTDR
jgi:hypothetical protein